MPARPVLIAFVSLALLGASAAEAVAQRPWPEGVSCTTRGGLGTPMRAGVNCREFPFDSHLRRYVAYVPRAAAARVRRGRRVPVVLMLHGTSGTGERFLRISGWKEKAARRGFIAVFPTGIEYVVDEDGTRRLTTRWSYYDLEDGIDETVVPPTDDVGFLRRVIGDVVTSGGGQRQRVYLSGFSAGSGMCMRAAMELTREIQAFGCNAAGVSSDTATIAPGAPARRVMLTYGNLDRNLLARTGLAEVPVVPGQALRVPALQDILYKALKALGLGPRPDIVRRSPTGFAARFDEPLPGREAASLDFVMLDEVEHVYPTRENNPHRFHMADILWKFFRRSR